MHMCLTGDFIDAHTAEHWGLLSQASLRRRHPCAWCHVEGHHVMAGLSIAPLSLAKGFPIFCLVYLLAFDVESVRRQLVFVWSVEVLS